MSLNKVLHFSVSALLLLAGCAKRQSINGGPEDETPPEILRATPPNKSTNFKAKEIRLWFSELITVENPQQQIIISPPLENNLEITPLGYATKSLTIKVKQTLLPNTTYSINFGNSIVDYNEKNSLDFYQYVFSTGKYLDSLTLSGKIKNALKPTFEDKISVFLYEIDSTFTDSAVYHKFPRYVTKNKDSSDVFQFSNLKEGNFRIVAVNDKNNNYKFDPTDEEIAFLNAPISLPKDTATATLKLFKEKPQFKFSRAKQLSKHQFQIGYTGELENPKIEVWKTWGDTLKLETKFFKEKEKDTLNYWVKPFFEQDSLVFIASASKVTDTLVARYKDQYKDSLKIVNNGTKLKLKDTFKISANTPLNDLDKNLVQLVDKDTLPVTFSKKWDSYHNEISLLFDKKENQIYNLQLYPNAVSDFIGNTNSDTLSFKLQTLLTSAYGTLELNFNTTDKDTKYIVQLLANDKIKETAYLTGNTINFTELAPGDYNLRVIYDLNNNQQWDTGNYLGKITPEPIFFYEKPITVRANWQVQQSVDLPSATAL